MDRDPYHGSYRPVLYGVQSDTPSGSSLGGSGHAAVTERHPGCFGSPAMFNGPG
ncbi:MAG: hypothetical protein OXC02_11605 [Rhodobacteraceae bacterium]|nr:hypothetical protein [Paracoccaceae bacterium]